MQEFRKSIACPVSTTKVVHRGASKYQKKESRSGGKSYYFCLWEMKLLHDDGFGAWDTTKRENVRVEVLQHGKIDLNCFLTCDLTN